MISTIFEQFVEASPLSVMVRALMKRIFKRPHVSTARILNQSQNKRSP